MINIYRSFTVLLWLFVAACSGGIEGKVFLDKNANNTYDEGEPGIGRVFYTITCDGKTVGSGITSEKTGNIGEFSAKIDKAGYCCVEVKNTSTNYASSYSAPVIEGTAKTTISKDTAQAATTASGTEKDGTNTDEPSKPAVPAPPAQPPTSQSLKACDNVTNPMSKVFIDVPVARNFAASLEALPAQDTISASMGEIIIYPIQYPCSCKPMNLALPKNLYPPSSEIYSLSEGILDFSMVSNSATKLNIASYDITRDALCRLEMKLVLGEMPDSGQVDLKPKAMCPDDREISLATQTIKWKTPKVKIEQEMKNANGSDITDTSYWGKEFILNTKVKNYISNKSGDEGAAELTIILPSYTVATDPGKCRATGQSVTCDVTPGRDDENIFTIRFRFGKYSPLYYTNNDSALVLTIDTYLRTPDDKDKVLMRSISITPTVDTSQ